MLGDGAAGRCPAGHYCPTGTEGPIPCAPGTYSNASATSTCAACEPGSYCPRYAVTGDELATFRCSAGYYCLAGSTNATPSNATFGGLCPAGHYCPAGGWEPKPCADGTYEPRTGSSACQNCPAGYVCRNNSVTECSGGYCPAGSTQALPCPDGYHDNGVKRLSAASHCAYCPVGKYCAGGLTKDMKDCDAGYYCDFGAASKSQGSETVQVLNSSGIETS